MTEQPIPLITFYKGWETYQQSLVEIIAPLSSEQLALPAALHQWTIGMLVQHMVANRVWWFHRWMGEGSPDLAPIVRWDPGDNEVPPALASTELVAGLEATWHMIAQALARWTPADLGQIFPPPAFLSEGEKKFFGERTRQWMIWYVLQHEIHHGGELSLALGGYGLAGIWGSAAIFN
ncbi:MAG: DinB family protein [Ktedonobacteraceae bacterium]